jgi:hypothetical protein
MATKAELVSVLTNQQASEAALHAAIQAANGSNSAMYMLGSGLAGLAFVGYMWFRRFKNDTRDDTALKLILDEAAKAAQMWRLNAEDANKRADEANDRADRIRSESMATIERVSLERNEAVQNAGKLTATVEHLQLTVENQTQMIEQLKNENKELSETLEGQSVLLHQVLANQAAIYDKFDIKRPDMKVLESAK